MQLKFKNLYMNFITDVEEFYLEVFGVSSQNSRLNIWRIVDLGVQLACRRKVKNNF